MTIPANTPKNIYKYQIDENDRINFVSENWDEFAEENNAADLVSKLHVLNKTLWDFISDRETRHLYSIVVDKVRQENVPVNIPFRCDSPNLRRFMKMTIRPFSENKVKFASQIVRVEQRESVKILDKNVAQSNDAIRMCSFCKQIEISESRWADTEQAIQILSLFELPKLPQITHGLCPKCYESVLAEIE